LLFGLLAAQEHGSVEIMIPAELNIRNNVIRPATILAPMAGVTDTVFRRVIRSLGSCGLIMTEFTSAEGLTRNSARTLHYLYFDADGLPRKKSSEVRRLGFAA
jgi:tRNA-dihydrouridine synthase